jgi:hypothetical protein
MSQVPPLPGSQFPEVLLLLQQASLIPDWEVRLAVPEDIYGVHALIKGLPGQQELQDSFLNALGEWLVSGGVTKVTYVHSGTDILRV